MILKGTMIVGTPLVSVNLSSTPLGASGVDNAAYTEVFWLAWQPLQSFQLREGRPEHARCYQHFQAYSLSKNS